tara:strand:- start:96 stop:1031 length:936 start_codon:yes stop_codon:yes gene_type:complete
MDNKQIKKIFNNMTTMGLFSGEYNSNPTKAEHHMECIQTLCKNVEGFSELTEKLWSIFDDKTLEEREKVIVKQKKEKRKKEKKKEEKFKSKHKRPDKQQLFRVKYRAMCEEKRIPYNNSEFNVAYSNLSDKEKSELTKEYEKELSNYKKLVDKEMKDAIELGLFEEPKPKGPASAYNVFVKINQDPTKSFEENSNNNKTLWSDLKSKNGKEYQKYVAISDYQKQIYERLCYERNIRVLNRTIAKCEREGTDSSEYTVSLEKLTANPIPEPPKKTGFPNYYETTNSNPEKVTKKGKGVKALKKALKLEKNKH